MYLVLWIILPLIFGNVEHAWALDATVTHLISTSAEESKDMTTEILNGHPENSTHVVTEMPYSSSGNDSDAECDHDEDHDHCQNDHHENHVDHDHDGHDDHGENHDDNNHDGHDDHGENHVDHDHDGHDDHDENHTDHDHDDHGENQDNHDGHDDHVENHDHHGHDDHHHGHLHTGVANSLPEIIISALIIIVTSVVGTIFNCLLVTAIMMTKKLRTPSGIVILMLSLNDLVLCLFAYPILAYGSVEEQNTVHGICAIIALIIPISYFVRIFAFPIIAFNRFWLITKSSSKYLSVFTRSKTMALIVACYAIPMLLYLIPLVVTQKFHIDFSDVYDACVIHNLIDHLPEIEFSIFILCFTVTVLSYVSILRHILAHVHDMKSIQTTSQIQNRKLSIQVAKMMAAVSIGFFVSVFPYLCMRIVDAELSMIPPIVHKSSLLILIIGSMINPVLFTLTNEWHRKSVKALVKLKKPTNVIPLTVKTA